jgi:protein FAM50
MASSVSEMVELQLKSQTVGLKTKEEFVALHNNLSSAEEVGKLRQTDSPVLGEKKVTKKKKKAKGPALSFADEEDAADSIDEEMMPKKKRMKNPGVDTSFLAKSDEEQLEESKRRDQARLEFIQRVKQEQSEPMTVTFKFFPGIIDGVTPEVIRMSEDTTRGTKLCTFFETISKQLVSKLNGKAVSPDLVFSKDNFLIPNHLNFYDLQQVVFADDKAIIFDFGAKAEPNSKEEVTVCSRRYYDAHRHLYPFSQWQTFDTESQYTNPKYRGQRENIVGNQHTLAAFNDRREQNREKAKESMPTMVKAPGAAAKSKINWDAV